MKMYSALGAVRSMLKEQQDALRLLSGFVSEVRSTLEMVNVRAHLVKKMVDARYPDDEELRTNVSFLIGEVERLQHEYQLR